MAHARSFAALIFAVLIVVGPARSQEETKALPLPPGAVLNLIPIDAPVVVVLRPSTFLKVPAVKGVFDEWAKRPEVKKLVDLAEPESFEQVTLVLLDRAFRPGEMSEDALAKGSAIFVKSNKPREWKALAAAADIPVLKATHSGKDYFRFSGDASPSFGFYQPDDTTMIAASEPTLLKMIEALKAGAEAKLPRIAGSSKTTIASMSLDFVWLRELVNPHFKGDDGSALALAIVKPIWEKSTLITARLDVDNDQKITFAAENSCTDEDGAKAVEKTVEAILTLTRNVAPEYFNIMRLEAANRSELKDIADLMVQVIQSARVSREDTRVRFEVSVKADLAKLSKLMMGK